MVLTSAVPGAFCDGDYNLVVDGKKIGGTAQRRSRLKNQTGQAIFAHAMILYKTDLDEIIEAVNRLHRLMKIAEQFNKQVHCDLSCLSQSSGESFSASILAERLLSSCESRLHRMCHRQD